MKQPNLGANHFTFTGERTQIVYDTQVPGPIHQGEDTKGGQLQYRGIEGSHTFRGQDITIQENGPETLVTVALEKITDVGGLNLTLFIPRMTVNGDKVPFATIGVKTAKRGNKKTEGPDATYSVLPLLGDAQNLIEPLKKQG